MKLTPEQRFWRHVHLPTETGCWHWDSVTTSGYGRFYFNSRDTPAHRAAYELFVGPVPDGMEVDHICHNEAPLCPGGRDCFHRRCVNPEHLEPVTTQVNVLRGTGVTAQNARKTHCVHGHEFTLVNTIWRPSGGRRCRTCHKAAERIRTAETSALRAARRALAESQP